MAFLDRLFDEKKRSASIAKNRLALLIAHEHDNQTSAPDFLPELQRELLAVISKYVSVNPEDIKVQREKQDHFDVLEINIALPEKKS